jgi:hypothetical protein
MTCGEYAQMANDEGWLKNKVSCKLTIVPLKKYDRKASYKLPVNPSPNIPNAESVAPAAAFRRSEKLFSLNLDIPHGLLDVWPRGDPSAAGAWQESPAIAEELISCVRR